MAKPLSNARHEKFAQLLAAGRSISDAYAEAGYRPSYSAASRLCRNVKISARIEHLKAAAAKRSVVSLSNITARLMRIADAAEKLADAPGLSVARASMMDAAKLNGLVVNRVASTHSFDLSGLTDDELDQLEQIGRKIAPTAGDTGGEGETGG